jgi:site-specific DNA recombinase
MKAIGYVRVSTEEQSREGISLEMQGDRISKHCEIHDLDLQCVMMDAGVSGKSIEGRKGLEMIKTLIQKREIDVVVVYKLDRLSRSALDTLTLAKEMDGAGVALVSISEELNTKSAIGRFFFQLTASFAEMERNLISERTTAALQHKKQLNQRVGSIPYGYDLDSSDPQQKRLIGVPTEQDVIAQIKDLKRSGCSLRKIAELLNSRQVATKKGGVWSHKQVASVVRRVA